LKTFARIFSPSRRGALMKDIVRILAVSDDIDLCNSISSSLELHRQKAICVSSSQEALQVLSRGVLADLILLDVAKCQSREVLFNPALLRMISSEKVWIVSERDDISWASFAAEWNIKTVLTKPLNRQDIEKLISQPDSETIVSPCSGSATLPPSPGYHLQELDNERFFLAASPTMMQLYREIRLLAPVDMPVLILGESGVGKEIVAMLVHKYHTRSENKFLKVNCAALPTELLESELFGYEAGAFTGAIKSKPGKFELANKGTLLLDEIGEMSPQMQAKLLHVLHDGSFCRLGARSSTQVDVRILAATNIDMQQAIAGKRFREDLFYRLNTLTLVIPPLRERREEIPLLMKELIRREAAGLGNSTIFSDRIFEAALEYHWPGNLRELRNFVLRTLILQDEESAYAYLRSKTRPPVNVSVEMSTAQTEKKGTPPFGMKDAISEVKNQAEIRMLQDALSACGWNRRKAATNLNISYRSLLYKIQRHRLSAVPLRDGGSDGGY
jgi:two-component system, NtrC family, response regulator AtoC